MFTNDNVFWVGISLIIIGIYVLVSGVKEVALTCSKVTSKCSVETRNFIGNIENANNIDLKTVKKAEFVFSKMNSPESRSSIKTHKGSNIDRRRARQTVYRHYYKPVLITRNGNIEIYSKSTSVSTNYHIPDNLPTIQPACPYALTKQKVQKELYEKINRNSIENRGINVVEQFNSFLTSPAQKNYIFEDKSDAMVLKVMACIIMGMGAFCLFQNARYTRENSI